MKNILLTINNFINKYEKLLFLMIVLILCFFFFYSFSIHTIPYTQGWGNAYVDLVFSGKFPYRDFYYYLPPLNIIIDCILWPLSFGHMFLYFLWRLAERMLIIVLVYNLLCKVSKPRYACIGTFIGFIMFSATVYDLVGDYNQTAVLLTVIVSYIYCKYLECFNNNQKGEYKYLLLSGIFIGLSFLHKQPLFVAQCIIYFIILTANFIMKHKSNYFKSLLITIAGILIPISIFSLILAVNGAFIPFIKQVYLVDSPKGGLVSIILSLIRICINYKYILFSAMIFILLYVEKYLISSKKENYDKKVIKRVIRLLVIIVFFSLVLYLYNENIESLKVFSSSKIGAIIILGLAGIFSIDFIIDRYINKGSALIYLGIMSFIALLLVFMFFKEYYSVMLYNETVAFSLLNEICAISVFGSIILIIYLFYKYYRTNNISFLKWQFIIAGALVYEYNAVMATTSQISNYGAVLLLAVLITFILDKISETSKFIKLLTFSMCIFVSITVMSQKVTNAYSWWGWSESVITPSKNYKINVPGLEGFRTTENTKNMYEKMYKVLKENTDSDSVIYGFPHVRIFNILLRNSNMNNFVPVPFYDVCPDSSAIEDSKMLKKNPPDIVIWIDIPYCMETHEKIFRGGKRLGQRNIQEWFSNEVDEGKYKLIGQYDAVFIYKLTDGSKIKYTYYKDKNKVNNTISEK